VDAGRLSEIMPCSRILLAAEHIVWSLPARAIYLNGSNDSFAGTPFLSASSTTSTSDIGTEPASFYTQEQKRARFPSSDAPRNLRASVNIFSTSREAGISLHHRTLQQVLQCHPVFERKDQISFKA